MFLYFDLKKLIVLVIFIYLPFLFPVNVYSSAAVKKQQIIKKRIQPELPKVTEPARINAYESEKLQAEMELSEIWEELKTSSEMWPLIIDAGPKEIIIAKYIRLYQRQNIFIKRSPSFYVNSIDLMAKKNPSIFKNTFKDLLKFVAIMEYDFDNGQDKDALARKILGENLYRENRKRLGL